MAVTPRDSRTSVEEFFDFTALVDCGLKHMAVFKVMG